MLRLTSSDWNCRLTKDCRYEQDDDLDNSADEEATNIFDESLVFRDEV